MQRPIFCSKCGKLITLRDVKQIGIWVHTKGDVGLVINYVCSSCKHVERKAIETDIWLPMHADTLGEMTPQERQKFAQMKPITSDELIEFYRYLRNLRRLPKTKLGAKPKRANEGCNHLHSQRYSSSG
jgi:ribosomal protein L37AE/L43A